MVQLATLIGAVAAGTKAPSWIRSVQIVLVVFLVTLAIQTPLVASEDGLDTSTDLAIYVVAHLATIGVGLGVARFLVQRRTTATA